MPIVSKIKAILGLDEDRPDTGDVEVTIEHEPDEEPAEEPTEESPAEEEPADGPDESGDTEDDLTELNGVGDAYAQRLHDAGIETIDELATADAAELSEETDIAAGRIKNWIEQAANR